MYIYYIQTSFISMNCIDIPVKDGTVSYFLDNRINIKYQFKTFMRVFDVVVFTRVFNDF